MRREQFVLGALVLLLALGGCPSRSPGMGREPPGLVLLAGERRAFGVVNGYVWPVRDPAGLLRVEEVYPPVLPERALPVSAGEAIELLFGSRGPAPQKVEVSLWPVHAFQLADPREMGKPFALSALESFRPARGGAACTYHLPPVPAGPYGPDELVLRLLAEWARGGVEATYYARLRLMDMDAVKAVCTLAERFSTAAWAGDREIVTDLLHPDCRGSPGSGRYASCLSVNQLAPWDLVLWRPGEYEYALDGGREVSVGHLGPEGKGPFAEAEVSFRVRATERATGRTWRWDVTEGYRMNHTPGGWRVWEFSRSAVPWMACNGAEPGWEVSVTRVPGGFGLGPFTNVNPWFGQAWDDAGQAFAFVGDNFSRTELWVVRRDGIRAQRLLALPQTRGPGGCVQQTLCLLGWTPDGKAVQFLVAGWQTAGPYRGRQGFWVGEAGYPAGSVRSIAFIGAGRADSLRDHVVTADRRALFIRRTPELWRVDLASGEVVRLANDLPSWDGLFRLHYAPDGWSAAYCDCWPQATLYIYNLGTGEKREVPLAGAEHVEFGGWTPAGLATVMLAKNDEVAPGEAPSVAALTALRFYDTTGRLKLELRPPTGGPGDRLGRRVAWSADGGMAAFAVSRGAAIHDAQELWVWQEGRSAPRKLGDLAGPVENMTWIEQDTAIEAWYTVPAAEANVTVQEGVRVTLEGEVQPLRRPIWWRLPEGSEREVARVGDVALVCIADERGSRLVGRRPDGRERLLVEGPFRVYEPRVCRGVVTFVGDQANIAPYPLQTRLYVVTP